MTNLEQNTFLYKAFKNFYILPKEITTISKPPLFRFWLKRHYNNGPKKQRHQEPNQDNFTPSKIGHTKIKICENDNQAFSYPDKDPVFKPRSEENSS